MRLENLKKTDPQIYDLVRAEEKYQADTVRLIPSENYASAAVMEALGTVFVNKYSEGYPGKRYYEGQRYSDELENLVIERAKALFHGPRQRQPWPAGNLRSTPCSPARRSRACRCPATPPMVEVSATSASGARPVRRRPRTHLIDATRCASWPPGRPRCQRRRDCVPRQFDFKLIGGRQMTPLHGRPAHRRPCGRRRPP
jgi:hypothetical protein